jgi:hypothetical protein
MLHDVFGEIKYDYLWTKNYEFRIFGETSVGILNIAGEEDEEIEQIQVDAFKEFESIKDTLSEKIEKALFNYYQSVASEYRDNFGKMADEFAPLITDVLEMKSLVKFEAVNIPYSFVENERVLGILFKSKWEIEHGVAVKIINGEIVEVGFQDIVL